MQLLKTVPLGAVTPTICLGWGFFSFLFLHHLCLACHRPIQSDAQIKTCSPSLKRFRAGTSLPLTARYGHNVGEKKERGLIDFSVSYISERPLRRRVPSSLFESLCILITALAEVSHLERCNVPVYSPFSLPLPPHFKPHRHPKGLN